MIDIVEQPKLGRLLLIIFSLYFACEASAQFKLNEYDEIASFSYFYPKIQRFKENGKINSLDLPSFDNDSLYWIHNVKNLNSEVVIWGIRIDTTIDYFKVANKFNIKEGFLWLFQISSPTAFALGVNIPNLSLESDQYITLISNYHDSTNQEAFCEYHLPDVFSGDMIQKELDKKSGIMNQGMELFEFGQIIYLEIFSPRKELEKAHLMLKGVWYHFPTNYRSSDAPDWIRKMYPNIRFDY